MAGSSTTSAPSSRSRAVKVPARRRGRVTKNRLPKRGRRSAQAKGSDSRQTPPTTITDGASRSRAASGRVSRVATTRLCPAVVPRWRAAAGMSGAIPASISPRHSAGRAPTPMRNTRVPPMRTRAS